MSATAPERSAHEQQAREALLEGGFDAMLLVAPANIAYVGGFRVKPWERLVALLVSAEGPLALVAPAIEEDSARAALGSEASLYVWTDDSGPRAAVEQALAALRSGARIGIEKNALSVTFFELFRETLPAAEFVDCGPALSAARVRKDDAEIASLRKAAGALDRMMRRLPGAVGPGQSELEIAETVGRLIREEGGDGFAFDPIVLIGENSARPHGHPGQRRLEEGDILLVDVGTSVEGYCADITRTFVLGAPSDRQREVHALVNAARAAGIAAAGPGVLCAEVDRAARSVIEAGGFGTSFSHRTGHGLGLEVHEAPQVSATSPDVLAAGMVFTVEPGVYLPGWGGVRIEDDVRITDSGAESLTQAPIRLALTEAS